MIQKAAKGSVAAQSSETGTRHLKLAISPKEIYAREINQVWAFLFRLGIRGSDIEDLAQETFMRSFHQLEDFDSGRPMRPWILGIAFRVASEHRRLVRRRREVSSDPRRITEAADRRPVQDQSMMDLEDRQLVHEALLEIPLRRRAVFIMCQINGESVRDIAHALRLPLQTVYTRLRTARREFKTAVLRLQGAPHGG